MRPYQMSIRIDDFNEKKTFTLYTDSFDTLKHTAWLDAVLKLYYGNKDNPTLEMNIESMPMKEEGES